MNKIKRGQEFVFLLILETFRFYHMDDYENDIFSTLSDARAWTRLYFGGKSDSTTVRSQNFVVTETRYPVLEALSLFADQERA